MQTQDLLVDMSDTRPCRGKMNKAWYGILILLLLIQVASADYAVTTNKTLRNVTTFSDSVTVIVVNGTGAKWVNVSAYPAFTSLRISLNSKQGIIVVPGNTVKEAGWDYTYSGGYLNITYPGTDYIENLDDFIILNPNPQSGKISTGYYGIANAQSDARQMWVDYQNFNWMVWNAATLGTNELPWLHNNGTRVLYEMRITSVATYLTSDIRGKNWTYFAQNGTAYGELINQYVSRINPRIAYIDAIQIGEEEPEGSYSSSETGDTYGGNGTLNRTYWYNNMTIVMNKLYTDLKANFSSTPVYIGIAILPMRVHNSTVLAGISHDGVVDDWYNCAQSATSTNDMRCDSTGTTGLHNINQSSLMNLSKWYDNLSAQQALGKAAYAIIWGGAGDTSYHMKANYTVDAYEMGVSKGILNLGFFAVDRTRSPNPSILFSNSWNTSKALDDRAELYRESMFRMAEKYSSSDIPSLPLSIVWNGSMFSNNTLTRYSNISLNATVTSSGFSSAWFDFNLTHLWWLNETSGTTANDLMGSSGTMLNVSYGTGGPFGNNIIFNSSANVTTSVYMNDTGAKSIDVWVNVHNRTEGSRTIFKTGAAYRSSAMYLYKRNQATRDFSFSVSNGTHNFRITGGDYVLDTWTHIIATYDGNQTLRMYQNGTNLSTAGFNNETFAISNTTIQIGDGDFGKFNGSLSNLKTYNRVLSQEEIAASFNSQANQPQVALNLSDGTYNFTGYAQDSTGAINSTGRRFLTIDTIPPAQVTGLTNDTPTATTVNLIWNSLGTYYDIFRNNVLIATNIVNNYYNDTALLPGTIYTYIVRAVDLAGNTGANSSSIQITTDSTADTTPPAQVTGLVQSYASYCCIWIYWNANTEPDMDHYEVFRDGVYLDATAPPYYIDNTLSEGTTHSYFVRAVDTSGNAGANSSTIQITTPYITLLINESSPKKHIHLNKSESAVFDINTTVSVTTYTWYVNGVAIPGNNIDSYTTSWSTPGDKTVTVSADGLNYTWYPIVLRQKSDSGDQTAHLNTSWFNTLIDSMNGESPDFTAFFAALMLPFTTNVGNTFYLFVYLLPLVVIWIRQERAILPVGLGIIFGGLLLGMLPEAWQKPAILFMVLTTVGVLYSLFKEKG